MPESEDEMETEAPNEAGSAWRAESLEFDPYAHIRSAMSPEQANLEANGGHSTSWWRSRQRRVASLAQLTADAAGYDGEPSRKGLPALRASKWLGRFHPCLFAGGVASVPGGCRREREPTTVPGIPRLRGVQKYPNDGSSQNYYVPGGYSRGRRQDKAYGSTKSGASGEARGRLHGTLQTSCSQLNCALDAATNSDSRTKLTIALNLSGPWGDSFKGALQATAGGDYKLPAQPAKDAADIADQAVLASGRLDENLWNLFMKCRKP